MTHYESKTETGQFPVTLWHPTAQKDTELRFNLCFYNQSFLDVEHLMFNVFEKHLIGNGLIVSMQVIPIHTASSIEQAGVCIVTDLVDALI